jgi:tyrosinase
MMDRMWTFWYVCRNPMEVLFSNIVCDVSRQALDPATRHCDISGGDYGHMTWANEPPSRKVRLSDVIDMGYAGESTTIGEVMDTLSGPLCYFYL